MKKTIFVLILTVILLASMASAGPFSDLNRAQKGFYWKCIQPCYELLQAQQYQEYQTCAIDCMEQAGNYVQPVLSCEDTDDGIDYKNFGTITDSINVDGKDDYCYTFSNGKTYLFEGVCVNDKYRRYQKNCKEIGNNWECLEGACVTQECDITEVENGEVSNYPDCEISCNEGYNLEDNECVEELVCDITDVENGDVSNYPDCEITCDEDFELEDDECIGLVCDISEVENGAVSSYPNCQIMCDEGYVLEDDMCVEDDGIIWSKIYGSPFDDYWAMDNGHDIIQTDDGGYIVVGAKDLSEEVNPSFWVIKLDENGDMEWEKVIDSPLENEKYYARDIIQDFEGNYVISGSSVSSPPYTQNSLLIKLDPQGDIIWEKNWFNITEDKDYAWSVVEINDGYVFFSWGDKDYFLTKVSKNDGSKIWSKTFDGGTEMGSAFHKTNDGGFIITGTASFDYGEGTVYPIFLLKTDSNGNEEWKEKYDFGWKPEGFSVTQDTNDNYIVTGWWMTWPTTYPRGFLMKTDSNGNEQWTNLIESEGGTKFNSVIVTEDSDYLITGQGQYWYDDKKPPKVLVVKTNPNGNEVWRTVFDKNSFSWSQASSGIQTDDGNFAFVGNYRPEQAVNRDLWVVKYSDENY
jgi:hypothetical protein